MAKAATRTVEAAPAKRKSTVAVTYRPLQGYRIVNGKAIASNDWDPPVIKWNGIMFEANVPVELDPRNPKHQVEQLVRKQVNGPDGELRTKAVETRISMIELAKDNPSFEVEGFKRARRRINPRIVPPAGAEWEGTHADDISESDQIDTAASRDFVREMA